ncbi:hypothetical protein C0J52_19714 [Blattella germanica]|nr:hypothetical protein C0J52_19714 [Blattella germanica]
MSVKAVTCALLLCCCNVRVECGFPDFNFSMSSSQDTSGQFRTTIHFNHEGAEPWDVQIRKSTDQSTSYQSIVLGTVSSKDTQNVVATACGVSVSTVQRVCRATEESMEDVDVPGPSFKSPRKKLTRVKPVTELDDFQKDVVRRSVQEFYDRCEYPTLKKLRHILNSTIQDAGYAKWHSKAHYSPYNCGAFLCSPPDDIGLSTPNCLSDRHYICEI